MPRFAMKIIDRYVGRGVVVTTLYGLFVLSLVLVLGNIFKELLDLMINREVPAKYLFLFMLYVLPFSFTFTVPWGFLTAVLLVFGRMSADNEMIALRACGTSLLRVCMPVLGVAVLLSAFTFWINTEVAPRALDAMRTSIVTIARSNPEALFVADEVIDEFEGRKIFIRGKEGNQLTGITLIEQTPGARPGRIISADNGEIDVDEDSGELLLTLRGARFEQRDDKAEDDYMKIRHGVSIGEATLAIQLEDLVSDYWLSRPLRAYTLTELWNYIPAAKADPDKNLASRVMVELSKRISLSFACIAFAMVAMPLGVTAQRKETSVGFAISLALAFSYFFFVVLAETFRDNAAAYPWLVLWAPNLLFIGLGTWLLLRLDYR
ncbi:MAG: YjgP/YjgQ family permease [Chthoniobacterales bacterium]|nr:YjgP/YjgQ family permease [Chthoniobacterales bacterium]